MARRPTHVAHADSDGIISAVVSLDSFHDRQMLSDFGIKSVQKRSCYCLAVKNGKRTAVITKGLCLDCDVSL